MALKKQTSGTKEPVSYAEIGAYLHRDGGQAKVKAYTSVNKPLQVDAAEKTEKISKLRVEMHVVEDKSVDDNYFYTKTVDAIQVSNAGPATSSGLSGSDYPSTGASSTDPAKEPADGLSPLKVLKNFVDNLASHVRLNTVLAACALALGAAAVAIAVLH